MTDADRDADRTIIFPHVVAKRHAEVAIDRQNEILDRDRKLATLLDFDGDHAGIARVRHVLEMGDDSYVVEVAGHWAHLQSPCWMVIIEGVVERRAHMSLDMALLRFVELHNGSGFNGRGYVYAARMLNVPQGG